METLVKYLGGGKFEVETRGHKIVCDQPEDNGGENQGMTPPELLLASLATCAGFYASQYLKARSLSTDGLAVRVTAEKAKQPARVGSFQIYVEAPGAGGEPRHKEGLERAVKACLIHNTLLHPPAIELYIDTMAVAAV